MVARIRAAAMAAVWAAFAFVGRAEVVSNCFSVVEYGDRCTHLVCDLEPFAGMEFVLDLSGDGIRYPYRWTFGPHHTKGWSYAAVVMPGDMISYLNFRGVQASVELNPIGEMYCAFTYNDPKPVGDTQDYLGWFHLREVGGKITIVSCAVETERGHRIVVAPGDPIDWLFWTDSKTMITWTYKVYGDVCGIGCGRVGKAGVEFPGGGCSTGQLVIPEKIKGLPVVKIESYAFNGCDIGELYIPESVTNIASYAFKEGYVSTMYFEDAAPTVEENAFDGLEGWCTCYAKIDADGWPNDIVWHGINLAFKDGVIDRKDEFGRERVDSEGIRWHDDVELTERIYRIPHRRGEGWSLHEEVYCETNVFTRLADASEATRFQSHYFKKEGLVEYYDLRLKKSEEFRIYDENWQEDGTALRSYTTLNRDYDEEGRLANESIVIEWQISPANEDGVRYREERFERRYTSGHLVDSLHKSEGRRNDDSTVSMCDHLENTWNDNGQLTKSKQHIDESDSRGDWRETDVSVECYYDWEGFLGHRVEKKTVSGSDGYRWREIVDDYRDGVLYYSLMTSGDYAGLSATGSLAPGEGEIVSAESEEDALGKFKYINLTVAEGDSALPVSGDAYLGYFKATATQVGADQWRVAYDVDPEAIELAESVADIGPQLGPVASGDAKTITISSKPGLYYGIATAESPVGPYVCPRKTYAWGDTVTLPAPDPKPGLFMRIVVGAKE